MWLGGTLEVEEIGGPGRESLLRHSCQTLSLPPRHHSDQPSHEQDQRQPFSGLPVGLLSLPSPLNPLLLHRRCLLVYFCT